MEPVTATKLPNPVEMERVIRAAGWLYCGGGLWRHSSDDPKFPWPRVPVEDAYQLSQAGTV